MYEVPVKMTMKKKIELICLIVAILWGIIFIINYVRYTKSQSLILAIPVTQEYDDGLVKEYIGLGYIYRSYQRTSISREELVPFWIGRENPQAAPDLPKALTGYKVPNNSRRDDKYMGLLYYYDSEFEFAGTYKCINTSMGCNKATSGYDEYNTLNKDPMTALDEQRTLGTIYDKFAFVDDSVEQSSKYGEAKYDRTIYLYKFLEKEPEILAKFADVKGSTVKRKLEYGVNNDYILKSADNGKWGLIHIHENGDLQEVLPYEYQSISYDEDTGYYILCKDNIWFVYDVENKKTISSESVDPIYDVWRNANLTYYFKTGKDRTIGKDNIVDYKIFRIDGKQFLGVDKVTQILQRPKYIMYITMDDDILHFMDYSGEEKYKYQLVFSEMGNDGYTHPAFEIFSESEKSITLKVWQGREVKYNYITHVVNTDKWEYNYRDR